MSRKTREKSPARTPDENGEARTASIQRIEAHHESFSGPIPPPAILQQYEQLVAGAADRLIRMAEEESEHRRSLEAKSLQSDIDERRLARIEARIGQICGLAIGLAAIGCGTYAALQGASLFGGFIGTGGVATLVAIFVWGRISKDGQSRQIQ